MQEPTKNFLAHCPKGTLYYRFLECVTITGRFNGTVRLVVRLKSVSCWHESNTYRIRFSNVWIGLLLLFVTLPVSQCPFAILGPKHRILYNFYPLHPNTHRICHVGLLLAQLFPSTIPVRYIMWDKLISSCDWPIWIHFSSMGYVPIKKSNSQYSTVSSMFYDVILL